MTRRTVICKTLPLRPECYSQDNVLGFNRANDLAAMWALAGIYESVDVHTQDCLIDGLLCQVYYYPYEGMNEYIHQVVDHAEKYVDGQIHTNGLENFWCLLKRCIKGTYVSVEPFHLFRYLDEQSFRFNNRKVTDQLRFLAVSRLIVGRRLTYKELTGKELA